MNELFSDEYAKKLENLAKDNAEKYANGKPFPHIYFDDFLPIESAEAALKAFPEPKQLTWTEFDKPTERKLVVVKSTNHFMAAFGPIAQKVIYVDSDGPLSRDYRNIPYARINRPIWPLDVQTTPGLIV